MKEFSLKSLVPHVVVIALFAAIVFAYFHPLFSGKVIRQGDIIHFKGMSREIVDFRAQHHSEPLWTNSMFGGMPAYQISVNYPNNLVRYADNVLQLGLPLPASYVFLYLLGFYILMLVLKVDPWLGFLGSVAYAFSSFFFIVIEAGHNSQAHAIGYMPAVLAGFILIYRGRYLSGGILTALFLSLELYCNHPQMTYYLFMVIAIFCFVELARAIKNKTWMMYLRSSAVAGMAAVIALGCNITNLWATYDYGKYTTRGGTELTIDEEGKTNKGDVTSGLNKSYINQWKYGQSETMTLLIPDFKGGASEPIGWDESALKKIDEQYAQAVGNMTSYFGEQGFTSGPVYVGAIVAFLFVLGLFLVDGSFKWTLLAATVLSIMLSWGDNLKWLSDLFLDHVPGYNKFRSVSFTLVMAELAVPILAVLAVQKILKEPEAVFKRIRLPFLSAKKNDDTAVSPKLTLAGTLNLRNKSLVAFIFTGGVALICWLMPDAVNDFAPANERETLMMRYKHAQPDVKETDIANYLDTVLPLTEEARRQVFRSDAIRTFLFIAVAFILLSLFVSKTIPGKILCAALAALVILDMAMVDWRWLRDDKKNADRTDFVSKSEMDDPFPMTAADQQILQDKDPDFRVLNTTVRLDQDAGTSYYHKSLGGYHGAKLRRYQELIDFQLSRNNMNVVNMLNAKYFIVRENGEYMARRNPNAYGNAWFVENYKMAASPDSEILALNRINPRLTAAVDKRFESELTGLALKKDSTASIRLDSYLPNDLVYSSSSSSEGLAVFSEIYYANGWNAYVDGKLTPHFRADYVLRAMRVPAGSHKIEFRFEPKIYSMGEKISLACSSLLLLVTAGFGAVTVRKKISS